MTPESTPPRAKRIALLAAAGLAAGLTAGATACSGAPSEVVVDPTPPVNTAGTQATAGAEATDTGAEATDTGADTDTGSDAAQAAATPPPGQKTRPQVADHVGREICCKGKNDCKGLGGCKTDRHDCMGKNDCKGLGGCKTGQCEAQLQVPPPPRSPRGMKPSQVLTAPSGNQMCCKGMNECKGKGNCKTNDNACKGLNDCKGKGGCAGPC